MATGVRAYYEAHAVEVGLSRAEVPKVLHGQPIALYDPRLDPYSIVTPPPEIIGMITEKYGGTLREVSRFVLSVLQSEHLSATHRPPLKTAGHNLKHVQGIAARLLVPKRIVRGTLDSVFMRAITRDQAEGPALRQMLQPNPRLKPPERLRSQAYFLLWGNLVPAPRMDRRVAAVCLVAGDADISDPRPIIWPRYLGILLSQNETAEKSNLFEV